MLNFLTSIKGTENCFTLRVTTDLLENKTINQSMQIQNKHSFFQENLPDSSQWSVCLRSQLRGVSVAARGLALLVAACGAQAPRGSGFCRRARAPGAGSSSFSTRLSRCSSWARELWCAGLVAPWHVGSSWTRDRTCVLCIDRRVPINCTAREVRQTNDFKIKLGKPVYFWPYCGA